MCTKWRNLEGNGVFWSAPSGLKKTVQKGTSLWHWQKTLRISRLGLPAYISFPRGDGGIHGLHFFMVIFQLPRWALS